MFDEDERVIYEVRMQALADVESKIASAEQKGLEKGKAVGRQEGSRETSKAIAINLFSQGVDKATMVEATGLPKEVIERWISYRN